MTERTKTYVYDNEDGSHNRMVQRIERWTDNDEYIGKTFKQYSPNGNGWKPGLNGQPSVPYHLAELLAAVDQGTDIYILEGEKDVDAARKLGMVATTNPGGAGKWLEDHSKWFIGHEGNVFIVWDRNDAGRKHAWIVHDSLQRVADVQSQFLRAAEDHHDFSDHVAAGLAVDALVSQKPRDVRKKIKKTVKAPSERSNAYLLVRAMLDQYALTKGLPPLATPDSTGQYDAYCPAHDDRNPSLSVGVGDKQPVVLHCQTEDCDTEDILEALGLSWKQIMASKTPESGSFSTRVTDRHVDLIQLITDGIPPREYHAHSANMLLVGARHLLSAPKKTGKSFATFLHTVRMVLAGERVIILDRENGADEYARRLEAIMNAWQLSHHERKTLQENLIYLAFPVLRPNDTKEFVGYCLDADADVVIFDSQRRFLTDFGLKEGDADDYAQFMEYAIDPLFRARITTIILDNTSHYDSTRARGSVTKGDLVDVVFHIETLTKYDTNQRGAIKLVQDDSRFGDRFIWRMEIGGGYFGKWIKDTEAKLTVRSDVIAAVKACIDLMESDGKPPSTTTLAQSMTIDANKKTAAIKEAVSKGYIKRSDGKTKYCTPTDAAYELVGT